MKKVFCVLFILLIYYTTPVLRAGAADSESDNYICNDVIITVLTPVLDKAITDFYKTLYSEIPIFDSTSYSITGIENPHANHTLHFIIDVEIEPYLGPHIAVGKDRIRIELMAPQDPKVISYEHLIGYELPEHYSHLYIESNTLIPLGQ